jgi:ABC-type branched-subunit amino acid transport system substrate-binding protein
LRTKEFQLLGLFLAEDQIAQYLSRLSAFKLRRPIFGTHSLGGKEAIAAIQKYTDGAFFSANYVDSGFIEQYVLSFGSDIQITWAANAYDFAVLTAELFSKASPKPNAVQIVEAYQNVKGKKGVTGEFSYMDDPENGKGFVFPVVIKTITKEGIKVLEPEK